MTRKAAQSAPPAAPAAPAPPAAKTITKMQPPAPKDKLKNLVARGAAALSLDPKARAAADMQLPPVPEPPPVAPTRARCPHCQTFPMLMKTANYETKGLVTGSIELWRMLVCANEKCHAVVGMALVNISNPKPTGRDMSPPANR